MVMKHKSGDTHSAGDSEEAGDEEAIISDLALFSALEKADDFLGDVDLGVEENAGSCGWSSCCSSGSEGRGGNTITELLHVVEKVLCGSSEGFAAIGMGTTMVEAEEQEKNEGSKDLNNKLVSSCSLSKMRR